jgi:CRP-like cAMP-binding protein
MSELFKAHIHKFTTVSESDFANILTFFKTKTVRKKQNLLAEGQVCKYHYFVLKGCLRKFYVNNKGVEHTTEFAIENWWLTDNLAYERQAKTSFFIQAVEDVEVLYIDLKSQEKLLEKYPALERYFRFVYQRAFAAVQMRLKYYSDYSKEELYHQFSTLLPDFVKRVPQYLIASYLGFTPEYLSEIRAKKRS